MKKSKKNIKQHFRFTILNENTLDTEFTTRLTRGNLILFILSVVLVLVFLFYMITFHTPVKKILPGYLDPELKQQMLTDVFRLDSLSDELGKQESYISVVKALFSGVYTIDSTINMDTLAAKQVSLMEATPLEKSYRQQYEEQEKYNLTAFTHQIPTDGLLFYIPVKGSVTTPYNDKERHYGVDIATTPRQSVLSVLDGTVIFASYTPDYNYVVFVQHNNDFISVYRQMSELLKKEGDQVKAGEALAFIGKSLNASEISHLHFELWYKGQPLNPEEYIVF